MGVTEIAKRELDRGRRGFKGMRVRSKVLENSTATVKQKSWESNVPL